MWVGVSGCAEAPLEDWDAERAGEADAPDRVRMRGTIRDFQIAHPDFEYKVGDDRGYVTRELGADGKPVYGDQAKTKTTTGRASFDQWFRNVPGVNVPTSYEIELERVSDNPPLYRYSNSSFFPIDNQLYGNEGNNHNFHFTYELHTVFKYRGGEKFTFIGDDDVFVYINKQRVIDLGGVHSAQTAVVDLDAVADDIGLEVGGSYRFDFFFAERHTTQSNFKIETSIASFEDCAPMGTGGLVGLELVDVSGTPSISGAFPSVFSNELVTLAGNYNLDGDAISGGSVSISGNELPGGSIIEDAAPMTVADPTPSVTAAKTTNDNAKIPCVKAGKKCNSPVSKNVLSLTSKDEITLQSGSYYFDAISISGQAKLNIDGVVIIYLNGGATFNGGAATNPNRDSLTIVSASAEEIRLNGGGSSVTHIYAPNAAVRFSGTQGFIGTALGRELRISGTADLDVTADLVAQSASGCEPEPSDDGGEDGPPDIPGLPD